MILCTQPKLGVGPYLVPLYIMYLEHLAHSSIGDGSCHYCAGYLLFGDFLLFLYYINDVEKNETLVLVWHKMCFVLFSHLKTN